MSHARNGGGKRTWKEEAVRSSAQSAQTAGTAWSAAQSTEPSKASAEAAPAPGPKEKESVNELLEKSLHNAKRAPVAMIRGTVLPLGAATMFLAWPRCGCHPYRS